jgi:hypothetical protein
MDPLALSAYVDSLPPDRLVISVGQQDWETAMKAVRLSVSEEELARYEELRARYDNAGN